MGHLRNRATCGLLKSADKMTNLNGWMAHVVTCTAGQSAENTEASKRDVSVYTSY